ncbi:hypothetical protein VIBNIAM115_370032 [Vibrio nigripulchritudo AM115]|nr:hypothetical protein VIBNIAM115_370032 [Vibrio nigripulchritudo AM115]
MDTQKSLEDRYDLRGFLNAWSSEIAESKCIGLKRFFLSLLYQCLTLSFLLA